MTVITDKKISNIALSSVHVTCEELKIVIDDYIVANRSVNFADMTAITSHLNTLFEINLTAQGYRDAI